MRRALSLIAAAAGVTLLAAEGVAQQATGEPVKLPSLTFSAGR